MLINTVHLTLAGRLLQERRAAYKATVLLMLFVAFLPSHIGCGGKGGNDHKVSQGTTMSADKELDDDKTRPLRWTLGPTTDGDAARSIVFRAPPRAHESGSPSQPKSVLSRPMIQGMPEAICIGDDGSQFVGGSFSGVRDFDTGPGLDLRESVGAEDGFVTCFDRSGKYRWTTTFGAKQRIEVRGLAVSHGVLYAVCNEREGHVAVLAMDTATGAAKPGFGVSGSQMFHCGQVDQAAGIKCQDNTIFVPIRSSSSFSWGTMWGKFSFTVVLALDGGKGSAVTTFGARGIQTIGDTAAPADPTQGVDSVDPIGLALSQSSIYIVGHCVGHNLRIGRRQIALTADQQPQAFIAALNSNDGAPVNVFGQSGVVLVEGGAKTANDAVVAGDSIYVTGSCSEGSSRERALVAMLDAATGAPKRQFGDAGTKHFGEWEWQSGTSVRVNGPVVYVAGSYIDVDRQTEERHTEGVFVAAFNRTSGLPVISFGDKGVQLIEGLTYGEQGRIEPFDNNLFLIARTDPSREDDKHEVRIGNKVLKKGEISGFVFRLSRDGAITAK